MQDELVSDCGWTPEQRKYYFSMCRRMESEMCEHPVFHRMDYMDWHAFFKMAFGIKSTNELEDSRHGHEFIDWCQKVAASEFGVDLPDPESLV